MSKNGISTALAVALLYFGLPASAALEDVIKAPPTSLSSSLLRGGPGAFGAGRAGGKAHKGVDIVAKQSTTDKSKYAVSAVSAGNVVYARLNGAEDSGYGYTVVIDHGNDYYTQYSHLALNASSGKVSMGQSVLPGTIIGYMADPANSEKSSGNARSDAVQPRDKIQLHFEVFKSQSGRSSLERLAPLKEGGTLIDPTDRLKALGYKSF